MSSDLVLISARLKPGLVLALSLLLFSLERRKFRRSHFTVVALSSGLVVTPLGVNLNLNRRNGQHSVPIISSLCLKQHGTMRRHCDSV